MKRLVIKIGTSTLTMGTKSISRGKIEDIARQLVELQQQGVQVVLVSSGAVATARQFITIDGWAEEGDLPSKQALSAIGQPKLMQIFSEVFRDFGLKIAQCLLTYRDFQEGESRTNTLNTLNELMKHGYIPIINENDTVAVEELILGDNDKLSALVATLLDTDQLLIASDIDGIYNKNPHLHADAALIESVTDLHQVASFIEERDNGLGTGGMTSKISAVRICFSQRIPVMLVNGSRPSFIIHSLEGKIPCTRFEPVVAV
ncbi:glutamate 5-kinase [Algivirga pacifica]|uniref:Glutamate 5-kinase n=1 Tax=Algivirga pacifica TaxID=1162670 RepID=A0ABP9DHJ2_9BACT